MRALKKWRVDLLGVPFTVYTDHRTLECFSRQKHLSRRQARWQEFLGQYDFRIMYLKGEDNTVADALSRLRPGDDVVDSATCAALGLLHGASAAMSSFAPPRSVSPAATAAPVGVLTTCVDPAWLARIRAGYGEDRWCLKLLCSLSGLPDAKAMAALKDSTLNGRTHAGIRCTNGLLYVSECLVVPRVPNLREAIFHLTHDSLDHFGFDKSYAALCSAYY